MVNLLNIIIFKKIHHLIPCFKISFCCCCSRSKRF
nr:MAG TPA: hypothetical protein [Caudoviricetes sp.]